MSQSRNAINRDLVATINQILMNLVKYKNSRTNNEVRNATLTELRKTNINNLQTALSTKLSNLALDVTKEAAIEIADEIEDKLILGLRDNNQLSITYGYIHKSYEESRLSGHGVFSSWWHRTWHQSRASLELEASIREIQIFKKRHMKKDEVAATPAVAMPACA